jgi:hypothetical protein
MAELRFSSLSRVGAAALVMVLAFAAVAGATTYVLPPDARLVEQATVIAQATVTAVEPAPIEGPPSTDYFVQIEQVLKGHVAGGTVVVRVPGGIGTDGIGLRIWGAPHFREGERLLLFLEPRRDGTYGILHLMLGAFREVQAGGHRVAARSLTDALEIGFNATGGDLEGAEPERDWAGFLRWIEDLAGGAERRPDYLLSSTALGAAVRASPAEPAGWLEESCTSLPLRWFEFDRGEEVRWQLELGGFDSRGGGRRAFERARRLWSRRSGWDLRLERGAATLSTTGLDQFDGKNTVTFGDPNDVMSGAFQCDLGGVVAVTGLWFDNGRGQGCERIGPARIEAFEGRRFLEILGADIVANDGTSCLFDGDVSTTTRALAHELGHSLGLAHQSAAGALMWGELDGAAPGAELSAADLASLARLYGATRAEP